mmetsp:Transcript_7741/g.25693  ORF Transcript_7741/g.25693 Transcript_7741/m.25693 type:complete len:489 (-) Transcript_7741:163-1629(-)
MAESVAEIAAETMAMEVDDAVKVKNQEELDKLDREVEANEALARQPGKLSEALEALLVQEKHFRLGADILGTKRLLVAMPRMCFAVQAWTTLNEYIVLLSKRRSQLKQAIVAMVREVMTYLDKLPSLEVKIELIKTLTSISTGKIFLEVEKARLTRVLANIMEAQGKVEEACDIMQEVAVETYGALSKQEKIAFILEQVRLTLGRNDFVRANIIAKKINPRSLEELVKGDEKKKEVKGSRANEEGYVEATDVSIPPPTELKLMYYRLMIQYHSHQNDYLEMCRCYQKIFEEPSVAASEALWAPALKKIAWYVALSKQEPMQVSLLNATFAEKKLADLSLHKELLKQFTTSEIIRWQVLTSTHGAEMEAEPDIFGGGDAGKKRLADLRLRVIEHNIHTVSKYYSRITLERLAEILDLPKEEAETNLATMVTDKALYAKLDRPAGIINFRTQESTELLNSWAGNIDKLLNLVEKSIHHIHKEAVMHAVEI